MFKWTFFPKDFSPDCLQQDSQSPQGNWVEHHVLSCVHSRESLQHFLLRILCRYSWKSLTDVLLQIHGATFPSSQWPRIYNSTQSPRICHRCSERAPSDYKHPEPSTHYLNRPLLSSWNETQTQRILLAPTQPVQPYPQRQQQKALLDHFRRKERRRLYPWPPSIIATISNSRNCCSFNRRALSNPKQPSKRSTRRSCMTSSHHDQRRAVV